MKTRLKDYLRRDFKAFALSMKQMGKWYLIFGGGLVALGIIGATIMAVPIGIWVIIGGLLSIALLIFWIVNHPGGLTMALATLIGIWLLCYILFGVLSPFH